MTAIPAWEPVDSDTHDLLSLVAAGSPSLPAADEEWQLYVAALKQCRDEDGLIRPNDLRPLVRGRIAPRRISAFCNAAVAADLIVFADQWQVSDDHEGRNSGKPCRIYRWVA